MTHAAPWLDRSPLFPPFYYHPCLNYSVAAISITAAILYLAPPMLTASTVHSKYAANIPDKGKEVATQNQVQLVTQKTRERCFSSFFGGGGVFPF